MLHKFKILTISLIALIIFSCSATYKAVKSGNESELQGNYALAAHYFLLATSYTPNNQKAKAGLQRNGQKVLNDILDQFKVANERGSYLSAFGHYERATEYLNAVRMLGVALNRPFSYTSIYNETLQVLANENYQAGSNYFKARDWTSAIAKFKKSIKYVAGFKDSKSLIRQAKENKNFADAENHYKQGKSFYGQKNWNRAVTELNNVLKYRRNYKDTEKLLSEATVNKAIQDAEKKYREGNRYFSSGNYKRAYKSYESSLTFRANYKDAKSLMSKALKKAKIRVAIIPFKNSTQYSNIHDQIYIYALTALVKKQNVFFEVIDQSELQRLLRAKNLGIRNMNSQRSAASAGKALGLNAVVIGNLLDVNKAVGNMKKNAGQAYEPYLARNSEGKFVTRGKKVSYTVYEHSCKVVYKVQYQIVDVNTGQIVSAQILTAVASDQIKYATTRGNHKNLTLYDPADLGAALLGSILIGNIDLSLFTARSKLKSVDQMSSPIIAQLGNDIANIVYKKYK